MPSTDPFPSSRDAREPHDARLDADQRERFEELYVALAPALVAWARVKIRPSLGLEIDAEDLMQEVWFRALKSFRHYDADRTAFRSWIFGIAKNVVLEGLRHRRDPAARGPRPGTAERMAAIQSYPDRMTSYSRRLVRDESVLRFVECIEKLAPEDQKILTRCGLEGMKCVAAATQLGLSAEAVAKRWQRLRETLRQRTWAHDFLAAVE